MTWTTFIFYAIGYLLIGCLVSRVGAKSGLLKDPDAAFFWFFGWAFAIPLLLIVAIIVGLSAAIGWIARKAAGL